MFPREPHYASLIGRLGLIRERERERAHINSEIINCSRSHAKTSSNEGKHGVNSFPLVTANIIYVDSSFCSDDFPTITIPIHLGDERTFMSTLGIANELIATTCARAHVRSA